MTQSVLVIGGGIGGLAAATLLALRGHAVMLLERAPEIAEVGAGIQISPNGFAVLRAMGLDTAIAEGGAVRAQSVVLADYRRPGEVARLDLWRLRDQSYFFAHRADLIDLLYGAARQAGVTVELGQTVTAVHPGERPQAVLATGGTRTADVIVCADGVHSVGRASLGETAPADFTGQVAWRAVVPAQDPRPEARVTMAPGRHVVSYPLRGGRLMNLVAVQERSAWAAEGWAHADDPANLRAAFSDLRGPAAELIAQVREVHLWGLFRHPVARTWARDNVALLGDAAHPTLPFLAQGANLALEDAYALADTMARSAPLADYTARRRDRAARVVRAASGNAWKYHLRSRLVRSGAHLALALGSRLAPGRMMHSFDWLYAHDETRAR